MEEVLGWSRTARRDGLLALEKLTAGGTDAFVNKGLGLLVDGFDPDVIRGVLEVQVDNAHVREARAARVYEAMGGYSPTIGILGAVLGLIHVMQNLSDPEELGAGIAVAFVATIYGVGFANLFFLPIANKLKSIAAEQLQYQEMVIDGIVMIADGDNPRAISSKLEGYLQ
jgi:chemotaxis protein MotA